MVGPRVEGLEMGEDRAKRRDEIYTLLLAGLGLTVLVGYGVSHWSVGSELRDSRSDRRSELRFELRSELRYNLNELSGDELQVLPGIGASMARKITDYRTRVGGFQSVDQLSEVPGIGPGRLARLRPFLYVSGVTDSSDRTDVPPSERPISVASALPTSGRPAESH